MKRFINRENELSVLSGQYYAEGSSFMVIYGRRRVGKTALISEFIKDKKALYFLADKETEKESMKRFAGVLADYTGQIYLKDAAFENWRTLFDIFVKFEQAGKKILVIDEFSYMAEANPAFPSVIQWVWDTWLKDNNVMLILCGSLVHMMEKHALNYSSPLYGRRTGQVKLKQIEFEHYCKFYPKMPYRNLVELYSVTGGVPRYIELFTGENNLFAEVKRLILERGSLLYEEPDFLLRHEVDAVGSYFSIIKSIAAGNRKAGKICADIGIKQTGLPKYLKTLIDLDILERDVPVTESNPEKSKRGLYQIKDNFLRFWFRFIYPERARLETGQTEFVLEKIKADFIAGHVAHIYEDVCKRELWQLNTECLLNFNKLGRWWNNKEEIDIVALDTMGNDIVFAECKYRAQLMDIDVYYELLRKKELVVWNNGNRKEKFVLFSISGFTDRLKAAASENKDLILIKGMDFVGGGEYGEI